VGDLQAWSDHDATATLRPEDLDAFRMGRLLLLLHTVSVRDRPLKLDIDRIGYYDFFSANPFLAVHDDEAAERELLLIGFSRRNLSYQSSAQRFSNRRSRLQFDVSRLIAIGLVVAEVSDGRVAYTITDAGRNVADQMISLYAQAYRRSVGLMISRLGALTDKRLREDAKNWLRAEPFMIDIYE
jgi:hypothetical protein